MIERDEELRNAITDAFTKANIDARNLTVEAADGHVIVKGSVPFQDMLERVRRLLAEGLFDARSIRCELSLREAAASDSPDGRGRSPVRRPRPVLG